MSWISSFHDNLLAKTLLSQRSPETLHQDCTFVLDILSVPQGGKILDQCCGFGAMSLPLAQMGYQVEGVDITEDYIQQACLNIQEKNLNIEFHCQDAGTYCSHDCDAVFNWWTGFGYLESDEQNTQLINAAYQSLKSGGRYLLDVPNYAGVMNQFQPKMLHVFETDMGNIELTRHSTMDLYRGRMLKIWEYRQNGVLIAEHHSNVRLFSSHELVQIFTEMGFQNIQLLGNQQGDPLSLKHLRCICIGEKP